MKFWMTEIELTGQAIAADLEINRNSMTEMLQT